MKEFSFDDNTTLSYPHAGGEVRMQIQVDERRVLRSYVSFEELEKWVASIKEQIITSSNEQTKQCYKTGWCGSEEWIGCGKWCPDYPSVD